MSARKRKLKHAGPIRTWWYKRRRAIETAVRCASILSDNDAEAMRKARAVVVAEYYAKLTPAQNALYTKMVKARALPPDAETTGMDPSIDDLLAVFSADSGLVKLYQGREPKAGLVTPDYREEDRRTNANGAFRRKTTRVL